MNSPISALLDCKESVVHTVPPHATVFEAVQKMEAGKITALMVCDDAGRLAGVIHLQDLLRAGVV